MGEDVGHGAAGDPGVGGAPGSLAAPAEKLYTAAEIGELLTPKRGKRIVQEWAAMPDGCPTAGQTVKRGGKAKLFRLEDVKAWARRQGLAVDDPAETGGMFGVASGESRDASGEPKAEETKRPAVVLTDFASIREQMLRLLSEIVSAKPPAGATGLAYSQYAAAVGKMSQELRSIDAVLAELEERDARVMSRAAAQRVLLEIADVVSTQDANLAATAAETVRAAVIAARPDPADSAAFNNVVATALREAIESRRVLIAEAIARKAEELEGSTKVGKGSKDEGRAAA